MKTEFAPVARAAAAILHESGAIGLGRSCLLGCSCSSGHWCSWFDR